VSGSKDTTTGPERKPTEQKKEMDSRLRLSNGLEIRQPLAKRFLEKQRELQNEKMSPAPENKDTTTGPENTFTRSQSENYLPKYKLTRMHMERARQLSMSHREASASESKDTTKDLEKAFTRSQSESYLPKYKLTRMHMERARRLQNEIQPKQEDKIEK
jgi:DNA-directed RNA polymerase subunit K/omega